MIPYLGWYDSVVCKLLRNIMAMLGKTICYINSSCVALMWWVKTLEHKIKKEVIKKLNFINCCFVKFCGKGHSDIKQQSSKSKENYYIKRKSAMFRQFSKTVRKKPQNLNFEVVYSFWKKWKEKTLSQGQRTFATTPPWSSAKLKKEETKMEMKT